MVRFLLLGEMYHIYTNRSYNVQLHQTDSRLIRHIFVGGFNALHSTRTCRIVVHLAMTVKLVDAIRGCWQQIATTTSQRPHTILGWFASSFITVIIHDTWDGSHGKSNILMDQSTICITEHPMQDYHFSRSAE